MAIVGYLLKLQSLQVPQSEDFWSFQAAMMAARQRVTLKLERNDHQLRPILPDRHQKCEIDMILADLQ